MAKESVSEDDQDENFLVYFELTDKDEKSLMVTMTYYAFTTLSTVGLGDFHPRG